MIYFLAFIILWLPITLFYPTKIIHKKRLKKGKAIATSNHYSNLDPILFDIKFARKFSFMAKVELFKNKFVGWILKGLGGYPVDRENVSPSVFKKTLNDLKNNKTVFIFPEGTRNKDGSEDMKTVKQGIITFASKGEAEIIPMMIYQKPKAFRKNYIIVGESFKVEGANPKRLTKEEIEKNLEIYSTKMDELRKELDEFVDNKKHKNKKKK